MVLWQNSYACGVINFAVTNVVYNSCIVVTSKLYNTPLLPKTRNYNRKKKKSNHCFHKLVW